MKFRGIKWWKEKHQREEQLCVLFHKHLDLFAVWHNILYPVKKMITITGNKPDEVSKKAAAAMARLYELRSFDKCDAHYPGEVKRLYSLKGVPVMEMNQYEEENVIKIIATISYAQYALKPGFTEEAFYAAAEAGDKATEEYVRYRNECLDFGMKDI